jgi:6-phosphogluconate dehydrogenase
MEKSIANFGIMGLGVMGRMLALNMDRNGFTVAGFDLENSKIEYLKSDVQSKNIRICGSLQEFIETLELPRRILIMVPAGKAVDAAISSLKPYLTVGDLIIDGGNTHFLDTDRRSIALEAEGIVFIGTGISGGEQGALWGPSIMPGGQPEAWQLVKPIFEAIAAKVDGNPCVAYMGARGAGHFVKMIHNGIEYADMQLIAEAYDLLHRVLGLNNEALYQVFKKWNEGELMSYLIEITRDIFRKIDHETGKHVVDLILDEAQQKGTGKWTSQTALDLGAPIPTINAAVESRIISALTNERIIASQILNGPSINLQQNREETIEMIENALYAAKICSYSQGFALLRLAVTEYHYDFNFSEIARIWSGGCIIRARLLQSIQKAFLNNPNLNNLMIDPDFAEELNKRQSALRKVVSIAAENGVPLLAFSSALAYYDAYRCNRLPSNLTQAQRDYFGAHTYRRVDRSGIFHTEWQ